MHLLVIPVTVNEPRSYTGRQMSPTALTPSISLSWWCSTFVKKIKSDYGQECNSTIKLTVPCMSSWRWSWSLLSVGFLTHRKYTFWCTWQYKLGAEEKSFDPCILTVTLVCSAASATEKSGTAKFLHQLVIMQETDGDYRFHGLGGGVGFGLLFVFFLTCTVCSIYP